MNWRGGIDADKYASVCGKIWKLWSMETECYQMERSDWKRLLKSKSMKTSYFSKAYRDNVCWLSQMRKRKLYEWRGLSNKEKKLNPLGREAP